jgi:hypothetical protein
MSNMFCLGALIALLIVIIYLVRTRTSQYVIRGMVVNVISDGKNKDEAIRIMLECNARMIRLLAHLRRKYKIGLTDAECAAECQQWIAANWRNREIMRHLLRDFNYEAIFEHKPPPGSKSVAYSLDKGGTIMLCLREIESPHKAVDINTLMFVVLHEAAHVANYDEWGHEIHFWRVFKCLLLEAVAIGVYEPEDYAKKPRTYCGFRLDHNPFFDDRIVSIAAV